MAAHGAEHLPPQIPPSVVGIDPEALDPAARLLDSELAGLHLAEHEPHHFAFDLGHLRGIRIAPKVIHDTALPDIRSVRACDAFVDSDDAADVQLVDGTDPDLGGGVGHGVLPDGVEMSVCRAESSSFRGIPARRSHERYPL